MRGSSRVCASADATPPRSFEPGDVICEIETDKATNDFEAQDSGIVAKILVDSGTEVKVGDPIMVLVEDVADVPSFKTFTPPAASPAAPTVAPAPAPVQVAPAPSPPPVVVAPPAPPPQPAPAPAPPPVAAAPPSVESTTNMIMDFVRADADLPLIKGPLVSRRRRLLRPETLSSSRIILGRRPPSSRSRRPRTTRSTGQLASKCRLSSHSSSSTPSLPDGPNGQRKTTSAAFSGDKCLSAVHRDPIRSTTLRCRRWTRS